MGYRKEKIMKVELRKWTKEYKDELKDICNKIDRKYLSDRIPNPSFFST